MSAVWSLAAGADDLNYHGYLIILEANDNDKSPALFCYCII